MSMTLSKQFVTTSVTGKYFKTKFSIIIFLVIPEKNKSATKPEVEAPQKANPSDLELFLREPIFLWTVGRLPHSLHVAGKELSF